MKSKHTVLGKVTSQELVHIPATTYGRQPVGNLTHNTRDIEQATRLFASQLSPNDMRHCCYRLQSFK